MCYSGECRFEQSDGECRIYDHLKFHVTYGEPVCIVGLHPDDESSEEYINNHREHLDEIYSQWKLKEGGSNEVL